MQVEIGKKNYTDVTVEVEKISADDVIKTSGETPEVPDDQGGLWSPFV